MILVSSILRVKPLLRVKGELMENVHAVYFSGSGTTRRVASLVVQGMGAEAVEHDLVLEPPREAVAFGADDVVVFAFPVFGGRLPSVAVDMLESFHGTGTRAVAVVVYGNRAYDDALLELADTLEERGFVPVAAAAFVAQHSLFPRVAAGRPDAADEEAALAFGRACAERIADPGAGRVAVPGDTPYRQAGAAGLHPSGSRACTGCGTCVRRCPVQAIDAADPRKTDGERCISCTACIAACPQGARGFHVPILYPLMGAVFAASVKQRREPETFLA